MLLEQARFAKHLSACVAAVVAAVLLLHVKLEESPRREAGATRRLPAEVQRSAAVGDQVALKLALRHKAALAAVVRARVRVDTSVHKLMLAQLKMLQPR